jgi:hypothetical protein
LARAYTIATVALALDVEKKWLDNVLTHYRIPGISRERQGISRRLSSEATFILAVAINLTDAFGVPISHSTSLAKSLIDGRGSYVSPTGFSITFDFSSFEASVHDRLAAAVEIAPVPARGRPISK